MGWIAPIKFAAIHHFVIVDHQLDRGITRPVVVPVRTIEQTLATAVFLLGVDEITTQDDFFFTAIAGQRSIHVVVYRVCLCSWS